MIAQNHEKNLDQVKNRMSLVPVRLLVVIVCAILSLSACYLPGGVRRSGRSDLFAVACYSVPFLHSSWDFDRVEVIDKDKYGRVLYKYTSNSDALFEYNGNHICALLVCQKSDEKYAYYYENYSFIISTGDETFSESDTQRLKELNDWGTELVSVKLSKVLNSFGPYGKQSFFEPEKAEDAVKSYLDLQTSPLFFTDLIAIDADKRIFYALREYYKSAKGYVFGKTYFVISDKAFNIDSVSSIMIVDDIINCQEDMQSFKDRNSWQPVK
jgi:hypothetical protein